MIELKCDVGYFDLIQENKQNFVITDFNSELEVGSEAMLRAWKEAEQGILAEREGWAHKSYGFVARGAWVLAGAGQVASLADGQRVRVRKIQKLKQERMLVEVQILK